MSWPAAQHVSQAWAWRWYWRRLEARVAGRKHQSWPGENRFLKAAIARKPAIGEGRLHNNVMIVVSGIFCWRNEMHIDRGRVFACSARASRALLRLGIGASW